MEYHGVVFELCVAGNELREMPGRWMWWWLWRLWRCLPGRWLGWTTMDYNSWKWLTFVDFFLLDSITLKSKGISNAERYWTLLEQKWTLKNVALEKAKFWQLCVGSFGLHDVCNLFDAFDCLWTFCMVWVKYCSMDFLMLWHCPQQKQKEQKGSSISTMFFSPLAVSISLECVWSPDISIQQADWRANN